MQQPVVPFWSNERAVTQSLTTIRRMDEGIELIAIGGRTHRPRWQRVGQDVKEMLAVAMVSFLCGATFSWLIGVLS